MTRRNRQGRGFLPRSCLVLILLTGWGPPAAASPDATLYELTENMALDNTMMPRLRTAMAALQGTARVGSPPCPEVLIGTLLALGLITEARPCTVTVMGSDVIDLHTGQGTFQGDFATVINLDNPVDHAEFVVMTGHLSGDLTLAGEGVPLIHLTNGFLAVETLLGQPFGITASFTGVFRLPFAKSSRGHPERPRRGRDSFYLGDAGKAFPVGRDELSLGAPPVRVDVIFGP